MSSIKLVKINNATVNQLPNYESKEDKRPILGADLFPELYSNIFLCAKKKSGKTTVIYNIIKKCANKNTKVVAFVSTIDKDKSWLTIRKFCERNSIPFMGHSSTYNSEGNNILEDMIDQLRMNAEEERLKLEKQKMDKNMPPQLVAFFADGDDCKDDEHEQKKKLPKYQSPEYLFIFDDLSDELRKNKSVSSFVKKHRHYKSKCIFSSQYAKDLDPQALKQMDYILLFKGENDEKLKHLYENADLSISLPEFHTLYHKAVNSQPYAFLYIDRVNNTFRICFDKQIEI
jgi:hypothetical protein